MEVSVTPAHLTEVFLLQEGKCAVTGVDLIRSVERGPYTLSIDRVNDNLGYVIGNVRLVIWWYNCARMKGMSDEDVREMCKLVLKSSLKPKLSEADQEYESWQYLEHGP